MSTVVIFNDIVFSSASRYRSMKYSCRVTSYEQLFNQKQNCFAVTEAIKPKLLETEIYNSQAFYLKLLQSQFTRN